MTNYFHPYGFILGLAMVIGLLLIEYQFRRQFRQPWTEATERHFWTLVSVSLLGGVIGARAWHVMTDWQLYQSSVSEVFKIWHGGLSILGAVAGGIIGLLWYQRLTKSQSATHFSLPTILDVAVFGLPFAQALGRLGNYVNQELYGLPTTLPWGITIEGVTYHPLWAYEAVLMLMFGISLWIYSYRQNQPWTCLKIGSGYYFLSYLFYYSLIRFWLDFLRIDKARSPFFNLGINQLVLLGIMAILVLWFLRKKVWRKRD